MRVCAAAYCSRRISGGRQVDSEEDEVVAVETDGDAVEVIERSNEKPGAHQQQERQGDLDDYHRLSQRRSAAAAKHARSALKLRAEVDSCRRQGRRKSEKKRRCHGHRSREAEDATVKRQVEHCRRVAKGA